MTVLGRSLSERAHSGVGVIVGGGITGCSLLMNLAERGTRCVLFEKNELTSGATWHAAGLVTKFHGGNNFRLWHQQGIDQFHQWQEVEGVPLTFHQPGSIRLVPNEQGYIDEFKNHMGKAKIFSSLFECSDHYAVSPSEIKALHPLVNLDLGDNGIYCGLMTKGDGHIDPTSVTNHMADRARKLGAVIETQNEVVGLKLLADKKWEVITRTSSGEENRHLADFVINAGGLWCDSVGELAGVHTPSVVLQHQYVISETIPAVAEYHKKHGHQMPVLRDLHGSFYLRDERDGILVGPYEAEASVQLSPGSWRKGGMPRELANYLFDSDVERLLPHLERATELVPELGEVGLKTVLNGPTMWPADGAHLVGPAPEWDVAPNFWQACAESYGIAHSVGLGRYLADWIVKGEPPYELKEADPARYGKWATKEWVGEKVRETYGMNNHAHFPNENVLGARPVAPVLNQDIYDLLKANGCQFGFYNGWEGPNYFDPESGGEQHGNVFASWRRPSYQDKILKECKDMADYSGICYWPFAKFHVSGPGAAEFLDRLCPTRLPKVGRCNLSYFLSPQGKIGSEIMLVRVAEDFFYVVSYPNQELFDWRWMQMNKPSDGVTIENVGKQWTTFLVSGPETRTVLGKLSGNDATWAPENFKFFDYKEVEVCGIPCRALRVSFTGELGWELHPQAKDAAALYKAMKTADPKLNDWGGIAMGSFRLERGFKGFGSDMSRDHLASEAGLARLQMNKNFIGRDALEAAGEPTRKLLFFEVGTPPGLDCAGNEAIINRNTGACVGFTTSGGWGYLAEKSIAFGYVDCDSLGASLAVEVLGEQYDLSIRSKAFSRRLDASSTNSSPCFVSQADDSTRISQVHI